MALPIPCMTCGEPSTNGTRCEECAGVANSIRPARNRRDTRKTAARGYDSAWNRLSARARKLQPFCSDCGATTDLEADHTPEAWRRKSKGLAIRLQDVDVTCGRCNRKRGAARGARSRSKPSSIPK